MNLMMPCFIIYDKPQPLKVDFFHFQILKFPNSQIISYLRDLIKK